MLVIACTRGGAERLAFCVRCAYDEPVGAGGRRRSPGGSSVATRLVSTAELIWLEKGACRGLEPHVFYPDTEEDDAPEAKAICAECSVRVACLEYALQFREKQGVWGGATERERRRIIRQRRRTA
jgi:WhiB family transcriptional regulator, redox-sensing transcriptional regulator